MPGPTIRCHPGDQLNITLKNALPDDESFPYDYEDCTARATTGSLSASEAGLPHGFNTTNLHTHGLHVSPASLCGDDQCPEPPYSQPPALANEAPPQTDETCRPQRVL